MGARHRARSANEQLAEAVASHHEGELLLHAPRAGALYVLAQLRERGFRLSLLSDCSSELCEMWSETEYAEYFDATVFSWAVGYRKPDPRGFRKAAELAGALPIECWFIGDGGSRELTGALSAGVRPALVTHAAHEDHGQYRDDSDVYIPSDVTDDIIDVPRLVGLPSQG